MGGGCVNLVCYALFCYTTFCMMIDKTTKSFVFTILPFTRDFASLVNVYAVLIRQTLLYSVSFYGPSFLCVLNYSPHCAGPSFAPHSKPHFLSSVRWSSSSSLCIADRRSTTASCAVPSSTLVASIDQYTPTQQIRERIINLAYFKLAD